MSIKFHCITIQCIAPEKILDWAERSLPNGTIVGELTQSETINYRNLKPITGGLFCQNIFGSVKDTVCDCKKVSRTVPLPIRRITWTPPSVRTNPYACSANAPIIRNTEPANDCTKMIAPQWVPFPIAGPIHAGATMNVSFPSTAGSSVRARTGSAIRDVTHGQSDSGRTMISVRSSHQSGYANQDSTESRVVREEENSIFLLENNSVCPTCGVFKKSSARRRYQLGYIDLLLGCSHVWYLKTRPAVLSILLDLPSSVIHQIVYMQRCLISQSNYALMKGDVWKLFSLKRTYSFLFGQLGFEDIPAPWNPKNITFEFSLQDFGALALRRFLKTIDKEEDMKKLSSYFQPQSIFLHSLRAESAEHLRFDTSALRTLFLRSEVLSAKAHTRAEPVVEESHESHETKRLCSQPKLRIRFVHSTFDSGNRYFQAIFDNFASRRTTNLTYGPSALPFAHARALQFETNDHRTKVGTRIRRARETNGADNLGQFRTSFARGAAPRSVLPDQYRLFRKYKIFQRLTLQGFQPENIILHYLPVLPPTIRPVMQMSDGFLVSSDLNDLYLQVIRRKNRLSRTLLQADTLPLRVVVADYSLLQQSVDVLLENGRVGKIERKAYPIARPFKSLTDFIQGKEGRFRQNLLGKRVDYSARSVIIVGPKLRISQCGIPKEIAFKLFYPFFIKALIRCKKAKTIAAAKKFLEFYIQPSQQDNTAKSVRTRTAHRLFLNFVQKIIGNHPILLNRAPTLHRLGIQAFFPVLVPGRAIQLHPLVCPTFNADFDGDQMGVHVPLSIQSQIEARFLMMSTHHWLSPATGQPNLLPSQDMVLGFYYLTAGIQSHVSFFDFENTSEIIQAYTKNIISLETSIWLPWKGLYENPEKKEQPIEMIIDSTGIVRSLSNYSYSYQDTYGQNGIQTIRTTVGRVLFYDTIRK